MLLGRASYWLRLQILQTMQFYLKHHKQALYENGQEIYILEYEIHLRHLININQFSIKPKLFAYFLVSNFIKLSVLLINLFYLDYDSQKSRIFHLPPSVPQKTKHSELLYEKDVNKIKLSIIKFRIYWSIFIRSLRVT